LVRRARELLISPIVVSVNFNCGGPPAAGAGGPRTDPNRPAEGGVVRSGNSCTLDIGGSNVDCEKWMDLQRAINPTATIQPGSCFTSLGVGTRSTNAFIEAPPGDYLVTLTVGDKTYKQVLRLERVGAGEVRLP
jgi:hypothetical protein